MQSIVDGNDGAGYASGRIADKEGGKGTHVANIHQLPVAGQKFWPLILAKNYADSASYA